MSKHSACPVCESETLARFVFLPIHINERTGQLKPSCFSHVHSKGCSIQRDSVARLDELLTFVETFLGRKDEYVWRGVLCGGCRDVRSIKAIEGHRAVCVYDTAEPENPAHGELCQTHYIIEEADQLELKRNLFAAFGDGSIIQPSEYRNGAVWQQLPQHLRARR